MKRLDAEDIIDLEIFIKSDEGESEEYKAARDFKIFSSAPAEARRGEVQLLKYWIGRMREESGGHSAGIIAGGIFRALSAALFLAGAALIGAPLANAFFVGAGEGGLINVSYFFFSCILAPALLLLSAVFAAPALGMWADMAVSAILEKFFKKRGGLRALYSSNRKWMLMKGALTAQYLGLGIACGIFFTQLFRPMFNEYEYGWRTTLPNYVTSGRVFGFVRAASLPWSAFAGEGRGYPSLEQVVDSRIGPARDASGEPTLPAGDGPKYEAWAVFFILSSLFYGVLVRLAFLAYFKLRIRRAFGPHRIRNDRKISEIIRRMTYSSPDLSSSLASSRSSSAGDTSVLLRSDMAPWRDAIVSGVKAALAVPGAEVIQYSFGRDLFSPETAAALSGRKNIAVVCLSDDYNEEAFENIENLVNRFPDKFVSVHLLGRLSKADGSFRPPLPVEKSWWERKMNSVSSRNLKLF